MTSRSVALVAGLTGWLALLTTAPLAQEHAGPHWTYEGADGPDHWGALDGSFSACQNGQHQSPIDIRTPATAADLPPIQFAYRPAPLQIINNGHTIQVTYAAGSAITVGGKRYELKQFHFHHPSEEKINGKSYAMVAHLVHAASDGSLAVVAVLLDAGTTASPLLSQIWPYLPAHEAAEQKHDNVQIDLTKLLPADRGYYTFEGSLTTPPCSENVTWFVLKTPTTISREQADAFTKIYPLNARPTQPLNGRTVRASR
jgi:carbonic anhydrase